MREFKLLRPDSPVPVGLLRENNGEFEVHAYASEGLRLPLSLYSIVMWDETRYLTGELAKYWICGRVEPPERPEMPDILAAAGLRYYDPWQLFLWHQGRCTIDDLYIEEIL